MCIKKKINQDKVAKGQPVLARVRRGGAGGRVSRYALFALIQLCKEIQFPCFIYIVLFMFLFSNT